MYACAWVRCLLVPCVAVSSHAWACRTGVSVRVAAMAASSRGHDARARVSLPWLLYRVGMKLAPKSRRSAS